jgi:hypothetical protein
VPALQAVREEPVHLVVHDQAVDPLVQRAGLVRFGERGEGVAAQVGVAGRGDAERREALPGPLHQAGPLGGAHPGDVVAQVALQQREHRALEHHPVEGGPRRRGRRRRPGIRLPVSNPAARAPRC